MITKKQDWYQLNKQNGNHIRQEAMANDEIDLMDLLVRLLNFIKRYNVWLLSAVGVGFLLGLVYFFTVKPLYKSEFIFDVAVLENNEVGQLIQQLDNQINENNSAAINEFNIDPSLVEEITLNESASEESSNTLSVTVADPAYLPELQQSIVSYISNNDFTQREIIAEKNMILQTLETLDQEQVKIDGVLKNIANSENEFINVADIFELKIKVQKEKIELENRLKHLKSVTVIQDFPQYSKPYNRNFFIIMLISGFGTLTLALLIAGIRELNKMIASHQNFKINS